MKGNPVQQSFFGWMWESVGPAYGTVLPVLGLLLFAGGCLAVLRSRRPAVIAACLAFVPLPLVIASVGILHGTLLSLMVMANSRVAPRSSDIATGLSTTLIFLFVGLLCTIPGYLVLALGLVMRTVRAEKNTQQ